MANPTNEEMEQSRVNMLTSRGDAAIAKASKDRSDEDWADIAAHRAEMGGNRDPKKDKPWAKAYEELDKRTKPKKKGSVLYDNARSNKDD